MTDSAITVPVRVDAPLARLMRRIYELEKAEHELAVARRTFRAGLAHLEGARRRGETRGVRSVLQNRLAAADRALNAAIGAAQVALANYDSARAACQPQG